MSMAAQLAGPALERLATVMTQRSGQPYKLRALLYSLWNGQPASLVEIVSLDYAIREDFCLVLAAFGYEGKDGQFFYNAITEALKNVGQFEWFLEEHKSEGGAS